MEPSQNSRRKVEELLVIPVRWTEGLEKSPEKSGLFHVKGLTFTTASATI